MRDWKHDELLDDLADHLHGNPRRMLWKDMPAGPSGSVRPDIFCLMTSFTKPNPQVFEVKVSKSDFRSDVTSGKYLEYLRFAGSVAFAVPAKMITKADLPERCGLMCRSEKGWRTLRAPTFSPVTMPQEMLLKLLMRPSDNHVCQPRMACEWRAQDKIRKRYGKDVAKVLSDLNLARWKAERIEQQAAEKEKSAHDKARRIVEDARTEAEQLAQTLPKFMKEAKEVLTEFGLVQRHERDEHLFMSFRRRVETLVASLDKNQEIDRLRRELRHISDIGTRVNIEPLNGRAQR